MTAVPLLVAVALLAGLAPAHGAEQAICTAWARESIRIAVIGSSNPDVRTATPEMIRFWYRRLVDVCGNRDEPPPLIEGLPKGSVDDWVDAVRRLQLSYQGDVPAGTAPATDALEVAAVDPKFDADWLKRCADEYRSFDPADGTVVRRHHRGRVKCPL